MSSESKISGYDDSEDSVQQAMGEFGRWQAGICVGISLLKVSVAWHQLVILFLAPPQNFWCTRPDDLSSSLWRNKSSGAVADLGKCEVYENYSSSNSSTVACTAWEYDGAIFPHTIVSDWDLVCGREFLTHIAQTVFMFGILVGNLVFGVIADKHGRKNPLLWSVALQVIAGVGTAFCTNFILFLFLRFLDAFATGGAMVTSFVICMEIVGRKWRSFVCIMYHIPFSIGHLTLPGLAYLFPQWRQLQLAISVPSLIFIGYYWLVPESPRWLLTAGRADEAGKVLRGAAKINKLPPCHVSNVLGDNSQPQQQLQKSSFWHLLQYSNLRIKTLCISFNWVVCGVCFFGLAQYMGQIAGDIFLNVAIGGLIEVPGSFFCSYSLEKFGRKKTLMGSQLTAGVACLLITVVPQGLGAWPVVTLSTVGIVSMSVAFPSTYLYSGELFPTVVRNVGVGFASMCARLGSMAAPFITGLVSYGSFIPPLIFGLFPIVGALLCLWLPETKNTKLPDTILEGESCGKQDEFKGIDNRGFQNDVVERTKL